MAKSKSSLNDPLVSGDQSAASSITAGSTATPGSIPLSGSEAGGGSTASDIAKSAGKLLVKIGQRGNLVLMAITPSKLGDGTLSSMRESNEQSEELWYHYTDDAGLKNIIAGGYTILPNKQGQVFLTKFQYSPEGAKQALFMGGFGNYAGKGSHVLIFNLRDGVPLTQGTQPNEWIHTGRLKLNRDISRINYVGENLF